MTSGKRKTKSSGYKDEIIYQAELAKPSGPMGDLILSIATGGLSTALSALMGPFMKLGQMIIEIISPPGLTKKKKN